MNRVYDPSSGTWNTPDPAQADVNTYRAFGNSPTNEVDPEGLEPYANAPSREERFNAEWERIGREYLSILTPGEFGEQQAKELTDYINQSLDFEEKFTTWFNSLPPAERYSTDPSPSVLSLAPTAPAFLQGAMKKAADYKAFLSTQPSIVAVSPDEAGAGFVRAYENNPNTVYVKGGNAAAEYGKSIARMGMRRDANVLASQGAVVGTMALMLDPTRSGRGNLDDALIMASGFAKGTIPAFDPLVGPETPNKLASPGVNAAEGNAPSNVANTVTLKASKNFDQQSHGGRAKQFLEELTGTKIDTKLKTPEGTAAVLRGWEQQIQNGTLKAKGLYLDPARPGQVFEVFEGGGFTLLRGTDGALISVQRSTFDMIQRLRPKT